VLLLTLAELLGGEPVSDLFTLDLGKTFKGGQFWRPFTGTAFLGPLSMHWATNLYFLLIHGARMENDNG
jgi:hypothetical protein